MATGNVAKARPSGPCERLINAGYVPISRLALLLSRTRLVDPARSSRRILPRRPLSLLSFVFSKNPMVGIELAVATTKPKAERAAVIITVRYFSLFGTEITQPREKREFRFFADPIDQTEAQCFFCPPPARARWSMVTVMRQSKERRIGVHGSVKPRVLAKSVTPRLEDALAGRQRYSLKHHLAEAEKNRDRGTAMRLLSRMIFLEQRPDDQRKLRLIADIDQVISDLAGMDKPSFAGQAADGGAYPTLFTAAFDNSLPLSKWLASEAISLKREFGIPQKGVAIIIADGENLALRVLAAGYAGYGVAISANGVGALIEPGDIPWVKKEELLSFLTEP